MFDITRWEPFQEMMSLRDAMHQLLEESVLFPSRAGTTVTETGRTARMTGTPAIDVQEQDDAFIVRASLPGVRPEDVHIEARNNQVTISGQVQQEQETERGNYLLRERRVGQFRRTFTLPTDVKAEGADASYAHGILTLHLPKSEVARARQIPIRTTEAPRLESGQVQAPGQTQGQPQTGWQGQPQMPGQGQPQPGQGQPQTPWQGQSRPPTPG